MIDTIDIRPSWTVWRTVQRHPSAADAFDAFGVDAHWCDDRTTIADAAARVGVRADALLAAVRRAIGIDDAFELMYRAERRAAYGVLTR